MLNVSERYEEIKKYDTVILYGCGVNGEVLLHWLRGRGLQPYSFAVSEEHYTEKKRNVAGLPVYKISELKDYADSALVVVSVREELQNEIREGLKKLAFRNVIFIEDSFMAEIKARIKEPRKKLKFQIHLVEHCNLNCRGCYHFSSLAEEEYLDFKEYSRDIKQLSTLFHGEMEEILLLGGEPLLHPDLSEFMIETRTYFPKGTIKILSNGILLPNLSDSFWEALRTTGTELWLTKYPISFDYQGIERLAEEKGCQIYYFNQEPVRTLGHQPLDISGTRNYIDNFEICYRANECIFLEHGKLYPCLISATSRHFSKYYNVNLEIDEKDSIDIYKVNSGEELLMGLTKPTPFCRYCNRDDVQIFGRIPWSQSKREMSEWVD